MISYAQNFEDVILRRVFHNRTSGFYIDVGAMDPVVDSVTKFFYDQGWCGINIEPNEFFFRKLLAERERDISLNIALGDREENRTLYASNVTGFSTLDEQNRDLFVQRGFQAEEKIVEISTLAAVCEQHADRPIDFLKVDCEGWEKQVLTGADWSRFRPTVVLVEATLPGVPTPGWSGWEPVLVEEAQYDMVYFDGLNRFYLRRDSPGLRTHFNLPPNVFDEFKLHSLESAERAGQAMMRERDSLGMRIAELEQRLSTRAAEADQAIQALKQERDSLAAGLAEFEMQISRGGARIADLEKEHRELGQALLKARLWVGRLSQDLVASKQRRQR
jgi:FkbM family methyltransferase